MRRALLACCFLAFATPALAQRDGLYDVRGTNLDGTSYEGVAQIRSLGLRSFTILWRVGNQIVEGVGMASGRTVSVAYGLAQRPGMGIYTLNPDGSMDGEWTIIGANAVGTEKLTPRAAPTASGEAPATPATPPGDQAPAAPPAPVTTPVPTTPPAVTPLAPAPAR